MRTIEFTLRTVGEEVTQRIHVESGVFLEQMNGPTGLFEHSTENIHQRRFT